MRSGAPKKKWTDVSLLRGSKGREDYQDGWQEFVGRLWSGRRILDVGAGLGLSRSRLGNNLVALQDIGPDLNVDITIPIDDIEDKSFDVVTAFDVIEHVVEDETFLFNLRRVACDCVFLTTPNRRISDARNPFHCREYDPPQLVQLIGQGLVRWFAGDGRGTDIEEVTVAEFMLTERPSLAALIIQST